MGNTFSFVGGDQAIADDDGWLVSIQIEDWDERFLGEVYLQLSEIDTGNRRDHFGRGEGRELDDLGTIECTIARGGSGTDALPFVCSAIRPNIASGEARHNVMVRLPIGGTVAEPRWSDPIRVPIRGEVAGESTAEGTGYEIDFTFKNRNDIPAGSGARESAVAAHSAIAPRRTRGDSPRTWIKLDFRHCPACWVLERKIGLLRRPASPRTDKIVGGNLWVGGKYFVDWFNQDFSPQHTTSPVPRAAFRRGRLPYRNTFLHWHQHCADVWSAELSVAQFAVMFAIIYNESTGFVPSSEHGTMAYFFEYRRKSDGSGRKNSYNRYGWADSAEGQQRHPGHDANRNAGDQLRAWWNDTTGKGAQMRADGLTEEMLQFDVWNGVWWKDRPDPPHYVDNPPTAVCPTYGDHAPNADLEDNPALAYWVRQCDFNKLRGRGMMQQTGRPHYVSGFGPAMREAGHADFDDLTDDELTDVVMRDTRIVAGAFRRKLQSIDHRFHNAMTRLGSEVSAELFADVGTGYSGGSGRDKVRWRSTTLHDAIVAAGWECRPLSDSGLAQICAGGSDTDGIRAMQTILADLGYGGTASGTFDPETGERLREFESFFYVQGTAAQRLTLESATQLLKWHEARHASGVRTAPAATAHRHVAHATADEHAPAMVEELTEQSPTETEPDEPADAGDGDDAAEPDTTAAASADEPPPAPEPVVTEATHDEHDTIAVEAFLISHALADCQDLERVARDPGFRRGDAEPLWPGDARATSAAIRALQTALRALGYDLGTTGADGDGIDGRWNARGRTVRAIQQHQRARGTAWAAARDPNVRGVVRTDGRTDWTTLYIIDRDARVAEDQATAAAAASSTPVVTAPSTPSEPVAARPETGPAADRPARTMTRRQALEYIAELNDTDGVGIQILDPEHGGPSGYGSYPNCRVRLPSPCYGVVLRAPRWSRTQVDPRLAVGVARLCRWLHDRGVIGVLQHEGTGGFLGNADRGGGPHGHGCALDLSSFDFDADHAAADHHGHDRLVVNNADLWPRYDARRFRCDGDPGLIAAGWRYASGSRPNIWRTGTQHVMHWVHASGRHTSAVTFHTSDATAPFERLHRQDAESPDMLVRADGVPAELELFRDPSLLAMSTRPSHADTALPFGSFIADLYAFVQREFKVNDTVDTAAGRSATVPLESFKGLVNPCHPRLGHAFARDGESVASRADGAGPRARFGHPDHLHLEVPDIDPALPIVR